MDSVPGLSDLPAKILSQCGLVSAILVVAVSWLAWQLAKTRAAWEADRAEMGKLREADRAAMLKIVDSGNDAYELLAVSHAKLEGILLAVQSRRNGD